MVTAFRYAQRPAASGAWAAVRLREPRRQRQAPITTLMSTRSPELAQTRTAVGPAAIGGGAGLSTCVQESNDISKLRTAQKQRFRRSGKRYFHISGYNPLFMYAHVTSFSAGRKT